MAQSSGGVQFSRKEVVLVRDKYELITDVLEGESSIKKKTDKYLPVPSCVEGKNTNDPYYRSYLTRALFYNVTLPTRDALVGQIFLRPPVIELPPTLEPMLEDANGGGLTLTQLIMKAANFVVPYGRGGLYVDFPKTNGEVTLGQVQTGEIKPVIDFVAPWAIRNWNIEKVGTKHKLTMVVFDEVYDKKISNDKFAIETRIRQRAMFLNLEGSPGVTVEVYEEAKLVNTYSLTGSDGLPLEEIPFVFIGSENNDAEIDEPPFYNMANINVAHYRNSADYEESVFLCGQPTPVYSGLTQDWVDNYFGKGIPFGSRASVPLPVGAKGELLQALPNTLAFEAMTHKEHQMIAIGAKIINPRSTVERKEAEIHIEAASQRSVLTTIKDNLQLAFIAALKVCCKFVGASEEQIKLVLNDNFDLTSMSAEELRFLIELYNSNGIAFTEFRENLRRSGIAKLNDEDAKAEITADRAMKDSLVPELEKKAAEAKNNPPVGNQNPNPNPAE